MVLWDPPAGCNRWQPSCNGIVHVSDDLVYLLSSVLLTPLAQPWFCPFLQVGAATAVLCGHPQRRPLQLLASKTAHGHAEPASGLVGLQASCRSLEQLQTGHLLHLRAVNPHVGGLLPQLPRGLHASRLPGPMAGSASRGECVGVSSFAFQVNLVLYNLCSG